MGKLIPPHQLVQPEGWKPARGYANGIVAEGRTLYLGGQIGWDADQQFVSDEFIEQLEQVLRNIVAILDSAGATPANLVRLQWFVTDKTTYVENQARVGEVYRRVIGRHFPAMTMVVVSGLVEDRALIEIEATAVIPQPPPTDA